MKTIVCFGAFDGFHAGHEAYLEEARSLGDRVCIFLETDRSALAGSGQLPGNSEALRKARLESFNEGQDISLCEREGMHALVEELKPDVVLLPFYETALARQLAEKLEQTSQKPEIILSKPFYIDTLQGDSTAVDGHDSLPI